MNNIKQNKILPFSTANIGALILLCAITVSSQPSLSAPQLPTVSNTFIVPPVPSSTSSIAQSHGDTEENPINISSHIVPDVSDIQAKCRSSKLTQKKILSMLHAISMHDDLKDIPFLETTLHVKLIHKTSTEHTELYEANALPGTQIAVRLTLESNYGYKSPEKGDVKGFYVDLNLNNLDKAALNFHNCKPLDKNAVEEQFSELRDQHSISPPPLVGGWATGANIQSIQISPVYSGDRKVSVSYEYILHTNAVHSLKITQLTPNANDNSKPTHRGATGRRL